MDTQEEQDESEPERKRAEGCGLPQDRGRQPVSANTVMILQVPQKRTNLFTTRATTRVSLDA